MITRREFIGGSVALALAPTAPRKKTPPNKPIFVNDVHSQLNFTRVKKILQPQSVEEVQRIIHTARKERKVISVTGGRHAMGGQEFGTNALLIDIRKRSRVLHQRDSPHKNQRRRRLTQFRGVRPITDYSFARR